MYRYRWRWITRRKGLDNPCAGSVRYTGRSRRDVALAFRDAGGFCVFAGCGYFCGLGGLCASGIAGLEPGESVFIGHHLAVFVVGLDSDWLDSGVGLGDGVGQGCGF